MGRLTDDMQAFFGLKPSDRVPLQTGNKQLPATDEKRQTSSTTEIAPPIGENNGTETQKEECFSCKVTGVSVLLGAAGFISYFSFKNAKKFEGWRRPVAYLQSISLTTILLLTAGCRAFELGPFDPNLAIEKKTPYDKMLEEMDTVKKWIAEKMPHGGGKHDDR